MAIDPDARQLHERFCVEVTFSTKAGALPPFRMADDFDLPGLVDALHCWKRDGIEADIRVIGPAKAQPSIPASSLASLRDEMRKEATDKRKIAGEAMAAGCKEDAEASDFIAATTEMWADKLDTFLGHKGEQP